MYIPQKFAQPDVNAMHELIRAHPLATLVALSSSGLEANHIPMYLSAGAGPYGTLQGHVARANPLWQDFDGSVEVLLVFHGPEAYISPSLYATKKETGKVVPTWNYAVVHAYGPLVIRDDAIWLREQLERLTGHNEATRTQQWKVSDAPHDYTEKLIAAVVGIEIPITRLSGKWKVSQNQPVVNQVSVIDGLESSGLRGSAEMAALVKAAAKKSS